ncbi:hypothetical protein ACX0HA_06375 [Flavobacterium hauense]
MKNIAAIIFLSLGFTLNAQVNKNVTEETKTTTVTVQNGSTPKTVTKTEKTSTQQNIELKDAESKKLNKDVKPTPTQVISTTTVSGTGVPTQVSSSSYYTMDNARYQFVTDASGYRISTPDNSNYAIIRKAANNNYIYKTKDRTSIGYFDTNGNFVVESYDDKTDGITIQTYTKAP